MAEHPRDLEAARRHVAGRLITKTEVTPDARCQLHVGNVDAVPNRAGVIDLRLRGEVYQAGGLVLTEAVRARGLMGLAYRPDFSLGVSPSPRMTPQDPRRPGPVPGTGGDCLTDVDRLRTQAEAYGPVASDPTVSRLVKVLATAHPVRALAAINKGRAEDRAWDWNAAGTHCLFTTPAFRTRS